MIQLREGNVVNPKIYFVSDFLRVEENVDRQVLAGYRRNMFMSRLQAAGISIHDYCLDVMYPVMPYGQNINKVDAFQAAEFQAALKKRILEAKPNVIVPLGESALRLITGLSGVHKWHCSILKARADYGGIKTVPLLHPADVLKAYTNVAYISFGCLRIKEESATASVNIPDRNFLISPSFEDTIAYLNDVALKADYLAVDVETGSGQINTFGVATSSTEAIAIETLPSKYSPQDYYTLWSTIADVMSSAIPKVFQNYIYDVQYLSRYGIYTNNIHHDTMIAMKFLHPELEMGLHNVGRLYTPYPYWKEDGKDWNNIGNWQEHLKYNCKDTTGTMTAFHNQVTDLRDRMLSELFYDFVMQFANPVREMCSRGLLINEAALNSMRLKVTDDIKSLEHTLDDLTMEKLDRRINARSPKQVKQAIKDLGYKVPVQKGQESTDKKALLKLKKKHTKERIFDVLLKLSTKNKMLGSYLNFTYDTDGRVRYSLCIHGTETGRFAGFKDAWGHGFNPQTVPSFLKQIFIADPGCVLVEIDLAQAESRYVAWDSADTTLMRMLTDGEDVHSFVAAQILNKKPADVTRKERQLGKKSGHAANYGVGPRTFAEACLTELDMNVTQTEAGRIISTYHSLFPGVRRRQSDIQDKIKRYRKLVTPMGRERVFYDRISDASFREGYAYAPQSTIPDITNSLMLKLYGKCDLLLQVHDSLLLNVRKENVNEIIETALAQDTWHPKIELAGGTLRIPVDIKVGKNWGDMASV